VTAPASQTLLVNQALALLGTERRITSVNDNLPTAKLALTLWDSTRDEVLADHPWNFALKRGSLAAESADYTPSQRICLRL
jgi:hypothetical protein